MTAIGTTKTTPATKLDRVVAAAADQFIRHGYTRTTMGDIARAAEISRPALYLLFPGKEQIFEAVVRDLNRERMAEIETALEACETLPDRLFTACDLWLVKVFELQRTTPDVGDMDDLGFPVVVEVYGQLQARIARLLADSGLALPAPAADLARGLVFAVRGFGATALHPADIRAMTRLQVDLCCRALGA